MLGQKGLKLVLSVGDRILSEVMVGRPGNKGGVSHLPLNELLEETLLPVKLLSVVCAVIM